MKAKKSLGQHFLVDGASIKHIVDAAQIGAGDLVIEIGPGRGALTGLLVERAACVLAIEIDADLCDYLQARFGHRFQLVPGDVQQIDLCRLVNEAGYNRAILVGNLPYQITGGLMRQITDARACLTRAVVMVQREVGRRIVAEHGSKDFGILSAMTQIRSVPQQLFDLSPAYFEPSPRVHSSIVRLDFDCDPKFHVADEKLFLKVVRVLFQQRRKMLRNTLRPLVGNDADVLQAVLAQAGVDGALRPEAVSIDGLERICCALAVEGVCF